MKYYFNNKEFKLIHGDSFDILKNIKPKSINMIFADPPYFLSSNGIGCHSGKQTKVNKGKWDKPISIDEKIEYNRKWISLCKNVLKDNGTIWISGTFHNIYSIGVALELEGFSIINNITWQKPNPTPNLACRCFTNSTETILWARKIINNKKSKHYFNYKLMKKLNNNKQDKDVWIMTTPLKSEKAWGHHPAQKPIQLLTKIILASTKKGDLILDCFNGSGTTGVAATSLKRKYIGIDIEKKYLAITVERYFELLGDKAKFNKTTIKAIKEADKIAKAPNVKTYSNMKDFIKALDANN